MGVLAMRAVPLVSHFRLADIRPKGHMEAPDNSHQLSGHILHEQHNWFRLSNSRLHTKLGYIETGHLDIRKDYNLPPTPVPDILKYLVQLFRTVGLFYQQDTGMYIRQYHLHRSPLGHMGMKRIH